MPDSDPFKDGLLEAIPHLRAFAHLLAREKTLADDLVQDTDDLVQDTIVRALANRTQFRPGTNLRGWLIVILRNRFFNERRRSHHRMELALDNLGDLAAISGGQEVGVEFRDFQRAFAALPATQREALTLIVAGGFSYEEAAEIADCPVGTLKSRVSRARADLQHTMRGKININARRQLPQAEDDPAPKVAEG